MDKGKQRGRCEPVWSPVSLSTKRIIVVLRALNSNTYFEQRLAHSVHLSDGALSWLFLLFITGNYVFIIKLSRLKMTKEVLTVLLLVCFQVNWFSKITVSVKPNFWACQIY